MLGTIKRPLVSKKEFIRAEGYLGRFSQHNLLLLSWIERLMQMEQDNNHAHLRWIQKNLLNIVPHHVVKNNPLLYGPP